MALNCTFWILHMKQFQKLMHSGSSPPNRHSSYRHPPPWLHPDQFGRLELGPMSRLRTVGLQSGHVEDCPWVPGRLASP